MAMYTLRCGWFIGIHRLIVALARRRAAWWDAPPAIVIPAELALARAQRWCSLRARRVAPRRARDV